MATPLPAVVNTLEGARSQPVPIGESIPSGQASIDEKYIIDSETSSPNLSETDLHAKWYEPPDSYESKHRWDPRAQWTPEEEKAVRKKLDLKVTFFACVCFFALCLDRSNIGNALSDNFLNDLGMTTWNYNIGMTLFYVSFLFAELPSQLISKKLGSDVWIPIQMMGWSAVAIGQAGIQGVPSFYVTRVLLGLIEGGFIADTILYLSYYYTAAELTIRLSWFWVSLTVTTIIGNLLAAGILQLRGVNGFEGWRYLFALEGTVTFLIGVFAYFYLPASPTQTKKWFRKDGWFTEREEVIIVNKVLRDDPTKSSMHNREGLSMRDLWKSLTDFDLWPLYLIGLTVFIAPSTIGNYYTLSLRSLGYTTFETNMLAIPAQVLFIIGNLALAFSAKRFKERILLSSLAGWWTLILLIVLVHLPDNTGKWVKWVVLSLTQAYPYPHPILVSLNSANAGSVRTRTVASSVYNMAVQAASLIASNVYQPSDAPYYHKGNKVLLGICAGNLVLFALTKVYYVARNKRRSRVWDNMTLAEQDEYIRTTKDEGNKRLDFLFTH